MCFCYVDCFPDYLYFGMVDLGLGWASYFELHSGFVSPAVGYSVLFSLVGFCVALPLGLPWLFGSLT